MTIKLNGSTAGSVALDAPASTTGNADIAFKLPVADGSAGQVLQTDGNGNLSWVTTGTATVNGITQADQWRITQGYNVSYTSSDANSYWERNDTLFAKIGTGMTESSGVFTFPVTGIWQIEFNVMYENGNSNYLGGSINGSTDSFSSSNDVLTNAYNSIGSGANSYASVYMKAFFDVTNTSTHKVKFRHVNSHNAYVQAGSSTTQLTGATFIRLGDT